MAYGIGNAPICSYLGISGNLCGMLYEVIFPWILSFAVIYGLLNIVKPFGDGDGDKINGIVALTLGFFVAAFTPFGATMGAFFTQSAGTMAMFLIVILGILLVVALGGGKDVFGDLRTAGAKGWVFLVLLVVFAWFLIGGWLGGGVSFYSRFGSDTMALALIVLVVAAMWYFVMGKSDDK
jgi:hypothetical protein